ncbi:uncharacterized protein LOC135950319 [Calliphora vicina]|uniref:uncharacterized protein LOC135950319 n=1 Tax=Calliphora vicina TaxID=7373 RepID=UPI00325A43AF
MNLNADWFYTHPSLPTPISVTHEDLQSGRQVNNSCKKMGRKQVNFNVYNSKNSSLENNKPNVNHENQEKSFKSTTYRCDYYAPYAPLCPPKPVLDDNLDPLFNRRPVNVFQMLPWAPGKFMDGHFSQPSEARKRINFFRQIRQKSFL